MIPTTMLPCDGCGQQADTAHISRRLQRLEWTTRFRPLHIQALLLSGISPAQDAEFLYTPESPFLGEAHTILRAAGIVGEGKSREAALTEFQKLGLALTHVLECPLDPGVPAEHTHLLLEKHLPAAIARVRRSLRPRRVLLFSEQLRPLASSLTEAQLGCPTLLLSPGDHLETLRLALAASNARAV